MTNTENNYHSKLHHTKLYHIQRPWVIANWKMNPVNQKTYQQLLQDMLGQPETARCNLVIAPNFLHLSGVEQALRNHNISIAAQNVCAEHSDNGAFTGEISAAQLADSGVEFVLIGHSERRQYYGESNDVLVKKISHAFAHNLSVILCVGETHEQYLAKQTQQVIKEQLAILEPFASQIPLPSDNPNFKPKLLIAYEPVWAIGTGLTPSLEEIEQVHNDISELLSTFEIYAPILYGGSVNEKNANDIAKITVVNGALVGGASLKAASFYQIVDAFGQK